MANPGALTKPLVVPEWETKLIGYFTPATESHAAAAGPPATPAISSGQPVLNPLFTINMQSVIDTLGGFAGVTPGTYQAPPNACALRNSDLYVAYDAGNFSSAAVVKFPGYLKNPTLAVEEAFIFTLDGQSYIGLTFDADGNLYVAEAQDQSGTNTVARYANADSATYPGATAQAFNNNYVPGTKTVYTAPASQWLIANLAFDGAGNLWATDNYNCRLIVFEAATLDSANPTWHALATPPGVKLPLANPAFSVTSTMQLFAYPEGLDFDGDGALWVANNNDFGGDGSGVPVFGNDYTTLVRIMPGLQTAVLSTAASGTLNSQGTAAIDIGVNCFLYPVPFYNLPAGPTTASTQNPTPQFGGLQVDRAAGRLYVNDENGGTVRAYDLSGTGTTSIASVPNDKSNTSSVMPIGDTNPNNVQFPQGNGGIALLPLGAYIADDSTDTGSEPDTTTTEGFQSPDIVLTTTAPPAGTALPGPVSGPLPAPSTEDGLQDAVTTGQPAYVYVKLTNFSAVPTTGLDELHVYWTKASAGLAWPDAWDGTTTAAAAAGGTLPAGGLIGKVLIPAFPPSEPQRQVLAFQWSPPDPSQYAVQDSGHFCLLARVITPNGSYAETGSADSSLTAFAGMTFPETTNSNTNALNNARIAQRNIHILDVGSILPPPIDPFRIDPFGPVIRVPIVILVINPKSRSTHIRLSFESLDPVLFSKRNQTPRGKLSLRTTEATRGVLERSSLGGLAVNGHIDVPDFLAGIGGIHLRHGEQLAIHLHYESNHLFEGSGLRVLQYAVEGDEEELIGGQTYLFTGRKRSED